MIVVKRDGREVEFDRNKVKNAVMKAAIEVDKNITMETICLAETISKEITDYVGRKRTVEDIQDEFE